MNLKQILKKTFELKPTETVLIVTDKYKFRIAEKIYKSVKPLAKKAEIVTKTVGKYDGEEPSKEVASLMKEFDVVIAPTTHSITHTKARIAASKKGVRIATMPGITEKMLKTSLLADPLKLKKYGDKIIKLLENGKEVRVSTPLGTNITFSIKGRSVENDDAILSRKGAIGNLPAGEVSLSPVEGTANGTIIIDIMPRYAKPKTRVIIRNGLAVEISDEVCNLAKIFRKIKNSRNIAELGIGTNAKAKIIGNVLQDEKVLGTCHIAFGNNKSYGGKVYSEVHLDTVLRNPTIEVDGKAILINGILKV